MIQTVLFWLIEKLLKGGDDMMAMLMAIRIVDGIYTFKQVPRRYKEDVRKNLILMDAEDLAVEE